MKIVYVEDFFHPDAGYSVNILSKYMVELGHEVFIVTSEIDKMPDYLTNFFGRDGISRKDAEFEEKYNVKIIRVPIWRYVSGRSIYKRKVFGVIASIQPDVLYINGNDTLLGMQYIMRSHRCNFPIVTDSHMLEMASENKFRKLFRIAYSHTVAKRIIKDEIPVIRTQDDSYVEKCLGIPLSLCPFISFGSDLMLFHKDATIKAKFRNNNNIGKNDRVFIYAGKLDETKGGALLANAIKEQIVAADGGRAVFIIVGNTVGEYGELVERTFFESENKIFRYPTQKYADLAYYYQAADVSIFPRQCSLSFYDVQACGLPVIAEDNNINIDRLSHGNGDTFESDSAVELRAKIAKYMNLSEPEYQKISNSAEAFVKENYDYMDIAKEYMEVIERTIDRFKEGRKRN